MSEIGERIPVFVEILNEGTPAWRPTSAIRLADQRLVLSDENYDADTEEWAVQPYARTKICKQQAYEGVIDVATEYDEPIL